MEEIGTFDNPIMLVPESHLVGIKSFNLYADRELLFKYSRLGDESKTGLNELKYDKDNDFFLSNVISNNFLAFNEVKIALYLYQKLFFTLGEIFSVSRSDVRRNNSGGTTSINVGELGWVFIGNDESTVKTGCFEVDGIKSLTELLAHDLGVSITPSRLTGLLRTLHSFSYITLTYINWYNTKDGLKVLREMSREHNMSSSECENLTMGRSVLKHIRICERMVKVDMSDKWHKRV
jgi:hypothetical protein